MRFVLVIFLAFFLRFWGLGSNPPALTWDEAAWGYNAYSLGIDGKDEFGRLLPLDYLESFGDFKPPVYAYLTVLPVKIFGLNEFSTRFPSAFFGVLTVLTTYFLVKKIFKSNEAIALLSSFLLAISPWHINLSRAAFEANIATFFLVAGVWLFLEAVQGRKYFLIFSAVAFVFSLYTFNTARIVAPLLVLSLGLGFRKPLLAKKKETIVALVVGILLLLPTLRFFLSPQASLRFREVNIFSDINIIKTTNQEIANDKNTWWSRIIHNRRLAYGREFLKHYFDNLYPDFLFIKGDGNPKFSTQDVGQLYLWELPFLIGGALLLFKKREGEWWLIPVWLALGIIPAAIARETPHALRIETTLPTFQIITAYGFINLMQLIKKKKTLIVSITYLLLFINFIYYFHGYWSYYPKEFSGEWQYGYKEAVNYIKSVENQYEKIYFTEGLGRPYIYLLFHSQYDPQKFRKEAIIEREVYGFVHVREFGKYQFAGNLNSYHGQGQKVLFVDVPDKIPENANIQQVFSLLNGKPVLIAYTF